MQLQQTIFNNNEQLHVCNIMGGPIMDLSVTIKFQKSDIILNIRRFMVANLAREHAILVIICRVRSFFNYVNASKPRIAGIVWFGCSVISNS